MTTLIKKLGTAALPALFVIGIGILEIKFPSAMKGFDDNYTGHGMAGLILLLIELFFTLTWGTIGGIVLITLTVFVVFIYLFSDQSTINTANQSALNVAEIENDNSSNNVNREVLRLGARAGKNFIERRRSKQTQDEIQ